MRLYIYLILMIALVDVSFSQSVNDFKEKGSYRVVRSSLGVGGSSAKIITNKGVFYISQSIGQSSPIGTSNNNGYSLLQGYQQSINHIKVSQDFYVANSLKATIYPNPFKQFLSISFDNDVTQNIFVSIFDINGKQVFNKQFLPAQYVELNLDHLSSGSYLLKVTSNHRLFNAKLIKK